MGVERVTIHIGSDKCGSKAIQESLWANRDWYLAGGYCVPETGLNPRSGHPELLVGLDDEVADEFVTEARSIESPSILLSFEGVHFFDSRERARLATVLKRACPGAELVLIYYVRNQIDLHQTGVLQRIKQLELNPEAVLHLNRPLELIPARSRNLVMHSRRLFRERIRQWQDSFPRADIAARLYNRERLVNGDVVADFHQLLGLEEDDELQRPLRFANDSLTAEAAIVLGRFGALAWGEPDRLRAVDILTRFGEGSGSFLHEDARVAISEFYEDDNRQLVKDFPDCEGIEIPRTKPMPAVDAEVIARCQAFLMEESEYPTLLEGKFQGSELKHVAFGDGWLKLEADGVWAFGPRSTIRFRPRAAHFTGFSRHLGIHLEGTYRRRRKQCENVIVNGRELGPTDLGAGLVRVPFDYLDEAMNVEITLEHESEGGWRPGRSAKEQRTFLLRSLAYVVE